MANGRREVDFGRYVLACKKQERHALPLVLQRRYAEHAIRGMNLQLRPGQRVPAVPVEFQPVPNRA